MKASELTNEQLKDEYVAVNESIEVVGCYGTKDLMGRDTLENEISKRNGSIETKTEVVFEDEGDEE